MEIIQIRRKKSHEMPFVKDDDVVEQFSAKATDHPFNTRVLPGRGRGRPGWLNARQYSRNRLFCRIATVRGWRKNNAFCQPDHSYATTDKSSRSAGAMRGRRPLDWYRES